MLNVALVTAVNLAIEVESLRSSEWFPLSDTSRANVYQLILDTVLVSFLIYILMRKPDKAEKPLSSNEIEQLIKEWEPEPMFPKLDDRLIKLSKKVPTITAANTTHVTINNKDVLAFARTNFTGMIGNKKVEEAALKALYKYGTGSCGPRGFYGTIDVHLNLEERIRKFMGSEDCIIYSYGFATISSTIPAFSARGDILVVDKGINYSVQTGVRLSRSEVFWYEHNDLNDLERVLQKIKEVDKKTGRKITRRFIVTEGLFLNTGDFANLAKIVELKEKYFFRLIVDDSYGVGAVGKTGRGTCELQNVPVTKVDILTGTLEGATSSVGGFCLGKKTIIYHQRLNASGYVFSASLPPLLTCAAHAAFDVMDSNPALFKDLQRNVKLFNEGLSKIKGIKVINSATSPVIHLQLAAAAKDRITEEETLQVIVDKALDLGVFISRAQYVYDQEQFPIRPTIRLFVSAAHSEQQVQAALVAIRAGVNDVLGA